MTAPNEYSTLQEYPKAVVPEDLYTQRFPDLWTVRIPPPGYTLSNDRVTDGPALRLSRTAAWTRKEYLRALLHWHANGEVGPLPTEPPVQIDEACLMDIAEESPDILRQLHRLGMSSDRVLPPSATLGAVSPYAPENEDQDELLRVLREGPAVARSRFVLGKRKGRTTKKQLEANGQVSKPKPNPAGKPGKRRGST